MTDTIKKLINRRSDKPCLLISGYDNKPIKIKPYAVMYLINHKAPDIYMSDEEIKENSISREIMKYWGEFTYQFDVLGKTELETLKKAQELKELITYKMRYQDWELNNIGITDEEYEIKALHELSDSNEWIYRYSFDVTFESCMTAERITEIAKTIETTINDETIITGGKK